jgi:hypothetical protein
MDLTKLKLNSMDMAQSGIMTLSVKGSSVTTEYK